MERYSRQTMLPEIGEAGQLKLKAAKVLIVGVGGLGSPIALYLAGAGVGTIGLADDDEVSLSNLQRQILYTEEEVGDLKAICASMRISALNREIKVNACPGRLSKENARDLIGQYDIIVDGCDNFAQNFLELAEVPTNILTDEQSEGFTGAHFGMYCHDMTGGRKWADFDYFEILRK